MSFADGLAGDRYADGSGTFSGRGSGYELTLVGSEALAAAEVGWEEARRNLVTRGIDLDALIGRRFRPIRVGDTIEALD